jgi:hypothetical protein
MPLDSNSFTPSITAGDLEFSTLLVVIDRRYSAVLCLKSHFTCKAMPAKPIFVGGTGSHAGKSWVATALCRYLYRMGHRVAPFKAQNMSNNSMVCADGGEIGRAQVAQAEACGLAPITVSASQHNVL